MFLVLYGSHPHKQACSTIDHVLVGMQGKLLPSAHMFLVVAVVAVINSSSSSSSSSSSMVSRCGRRREGGSRANAHRPPLWQGTKQSPASASTETDPLLLSTRLLVRGAPAPLVRGAPAPLHKHGQINIHTRTSARVRDRTRKKKHLDRRERRRQTEGGRQAKTDTRTHTDGASWEISRTLFLGFFL